MSARFVGGLFILSALAAFGARGASAASAAQHQGDLAGFETAVAAYATLHRAIARDLPPLEISPYPEKILAAMDARRAALRRARADARRGDIFTADAAPILRRRIVEGLKGVGLTTADLLRILAADNEGYTPAEVNATFSWATASGMPGCILLTLPPLPEMLQYRFVGPDLVLVDINANLIVDVLPDALDARAR